MIKRIFPDKPLGEPVTTFEKTFSAETVILETFFKRVDKLTAPTGVESDHTWEDTKNGW